MSEGNARPSVPALAEELLAAAESARPVEQLTARFPGLTLAEAYQIQLALIGRRLAGGRRTVGKKIGLTSLAMQGLLGVREPDYGYLLDDMVIPEGQPIVTARLIAPKAEGEVAFLLGRDLAGPGVTAAEVLRATEAVMPAIEVVDSRVRDWKIKIQDTVADNASSACLVLGGMLTPVAALDLRYVGMVLEKNGEVVNTGAGAAVLGNPVTAVAWLANKLAEYGEALKAGEVVLSGAVTAAPPVVAGDVIRVTFDRLGTVTARFA